MSFSSTDLSVLGYANGFTLWHYTTQDDDITTSNYFNDASQQLRIGDFIIANVDTDGSTAVLNKIYIVTSNSSGVVGITVYS